MRRERGLGPWYANLIFFILWPMLYQGHSQVDRLGLSIRYLSAYPPLLETYQERGAEVLGKYGPLEPFCVQGF